MHLSTRRGPTRPSRLLRHALFFISLIFSSQAALAQTPDATVAQDGSGNFRLVQAAIDAAPAGRTTPYVIYIKNGKYKEKINTPATKPFLQLVGESVGGVTLTYDDYAGKTSPSGGTYSAGSSASVIVAATDFSAFNITFENSAGVNPDLFALALNISSDRGAFRNCRFLGGQNTVYTSSSGTRQYFRNCFIDGNTDFIFGSATAVFDRCVIYPRTRPDNGATGYITAANTPATQAYGYVFRNCVVPANQGVTTYNLGRTWQNDATTAAGAKANNKVVFLKSRLGAGIIRPEGWSVWDAGTDVTLTTYGEYQSRDFRGNLVAVNQRVSWARQLAAADTAQYQTASVLGNWDPCSAGPAMCAAFTPSIATANFLGAATPTGLAFSWNASWAISQVQFELMRSATRKGTYARVSQLTAPNDTTYNFRTTDAPAISGTYFYYLRATKAGLAAYTSDTLAVSAVGTVTATLNGKGTTALQVYPNPATEALTIAHTPAGADATLLVLSLDGRRVASLRPTVGSLETRLYLSQLISGTYLLRYTDSKGTQVAKFTKQ
ncbi:T9SS type A sorting domain-containing protein [Hymenobacter setariae]|uniref:T9SS type A sorting domain-containing protein n=1 Tax=Hymenobacter setariae TaxID=2594794 RepID=A0A558BSD1_9BACT|nr:pectinesterase family protein [Hymenobacter setariae]TVT39428.1 T9SS type A sorting domain-containing protein [Hymenobacter setariae]